MGRTIHSIIETHVEGCTMSHTRKKMSRKDTIIEQDKKGRKHHQRIPTTYPLVTTPHNSPERDSDEEKEKIPHSHHSRSEAIADSSRFFHKNELKSQGATQTTTVTVNINDKDDCMTSCFSGLAKCFGKK